MYDSVTHHIVSPPPARKTAGSTALGPVLLGLFPTLSSILNSKGKEFHVSEQADAVTYGNVWVEQREVAPSWEHSKTDEKRREHFPGTLAS